MVCNLFLCWSVAARPLSTDKFALASNKKPLRIATLKNKERTKWKQNQIDTDLYLYGTAWAHLRSGCVLQRKTWKDYVDGDTYTA